MFFWWLDSRSVIGRLLVSHKKQAMSYHCWTLREKHLTPSCSNGITPVSPLEVALDKHFWKMTMHCTKGRLIFSDERDFTVCSIFFFLFTRGSPSMQNTRVPMSGLSNKVARENVLLSQ